MIRSLVTITAIAGVGIAAARMPSSPPPPRSVAVMEFLVVDASGRPDVPAMRARLAESGMSAEGWLTTHLAATGAYTILDSSRVTAGLVSLGQDPGRCQDPACLIALGRALGVDRVVAGRVSKLSNLIWFLYATMVDVPQGQVRYRDELEIKGNITDLLPKGMLALARRLAASDSLPATPTVSRLTRDQVLAALDRATPRAPADLSGSDLSGLDLSSVDFKRAILSRCRLVQTNFAGANLFGAQLDEIEATDVNLAAAVLDGAVLRGANLQRANLRGASLYGTILTAADLTEADLSDARVIAAATNAKLARAKLVRARLGADPGNQPMGVMRTDLTGADLTDADLRGADLRKVILTRANLTGADLTDVNVAGASLNGAVLRNIRGRDRIRGLDSARNVDQAIFQ
jgi:uncharacterized protein YjbI with pentapeptide repeats